MLKYLNEFILYLICISLTGNVYSILLKNNYLYTMKQSFNRLINDKNPVLVDFSAEWCGPCKMLAPILKDVKKELGDDIKIIKIDVDKNQMLSSKFQVRGVPTMILFKNGKQLWRQSGVMDKSSIISIIKSHL